MVCFSGYSAVTNGGWDTGDNRQAILFSLSTFKKHSRLNTTTRTNNNNNNDNNEYIDKGWIHKSQ